MPAEKIGEVVVGSIHALRVIVGTGGYGTRIPVMHGTPDPRFQAETV
jgi:hypothetical protein